MTKVCNTNISTFKLYLLLVTINSAYAYYSRGNITSKTGNGTTTAFTYASSRWKDQLIAVDDTQLTYDAIVIIMMASTLFIYGMVKKYNRIV